MSSLPGERRGGRKKGTPNRSTVERRMSQAAAIAALERLENGERITADDAIKPKPSPKTPKSSVNTSQQTHSTTRPIDISEDDLRLALANAADGTMTVERAVSERINKPFNGSAHDFLKECYRDSRLPRGMRLDAAKAAIRYETPALAATTLTLPPDPSQQLRDADTRTPLPDVVRMILRQSLNNVSSSVSSVSTATAATTLREIGDALPASDTPLLDSLLAVADDDDGDK